MDSPSDIGESMPLLLPDSGTDMPDLFSGSKPEPMDLKAEPKETKDQKGPNPDPDPGCSGEQPQPGPSQDLEDLDPDEQERIKMHILFSHFSSEQFSRYEMYRRSTFPKPAIRKIIQQSTGMSVSQQVLIAMAGVAKVFVGELMEEALNIREQLGESANAVKPSHLREALRKFKRRGQFFQRKTPKRLLYGRNR